METVEVVVRLPKAFYKQLMENKERFCGSRIYDSIINGTVLPKGHGALKDYHGIKSEYIRRMSITMSTEFRMNLLCGIIDDAPTIIEPDREVEG